MQSDSIRYISLDMLFNRFLAQEYQFSRSKYFYRYFHEFLKNIFGHSVIFPSRNVVFPSTWLFKLKFSSTVDTVQIVFRKVKKILSFCRTSRKTEVIKSQRISARCHCKFCVKVHYKSRRIKCNRERRRKISISFSSSVSLYVFSGYN